MPTKQTDKKLGIIDKNRTQYLPNNVEKLANSGQVYTYYCDICHIYCVILITFFARRHQFLSQNAGFKQKTGRHRVAQVVFGAQRIKVIKNDIAKMNKVAPKTYIVPSFTGVAMLSRKD